VKHILFFVVAGVCGLSAVVNMVAGNSGYAITFGAIAVFWLVFAIKVRSEDR
jgi:UDP-N-acetylmuramyl pentapeptide phosphotransferase/UDP-N-acetylglucosamine-1-phosphate transferase